MEAKPPPYPEYRTQWAQPTFEYRVVLWEQPEIENVDPETIGWGEMTFDLVDAQDVQEAIEWAEHQLASGLGPYSSSGTAVRDRECVIYARVPDEDRFVQVAGWDPSRSPRGENLRRLNRHS